MKNYLLARLQESTTWRGIILIATAAGVHLSPELQNTIISAGIGLAGLVAVLTEERK